MISPVRVLCKVPEDLFAAFQDEVKSINWNDLPFPDPRRLNPVFASCGTLHLRVHDVPAGVPHTVAAISEVLDCIDTRARKLFPVTNQVVDWILGTIGGGKTGRIMVVNMNPGGKIPSHVDPGTYFRTYYRFHVPVQTQPEVTFTGPDGSKTYHMPLGYLCQLLNCNLHGVENNSSQQRIHLIADLASDQNQFKYPIDPVNTLEY